jgi:hypothetical protein
MGHGREDIQVFVPNMGESRLDIYEKTITGAQGGGKIYSFDVSCELSSLALLTHGWSVSNLVQKEI